MNDQPRGPHNPIAAIVNCDRAVARPLQQPPQRLARRHLAGDALGPNMGQAGFGADNVKTDLTRQRRQRLVEGFSRNRNTRRIGKRRNRHCHHNQQGSDARPQPC
jgi:hypothetical protein